MSFDVVVVGSINRDVTLVAPRHPVPGETVLGTGHFEGAGGKGANQAIAASRLGASVAMIGRVGDDDAGRSMTGNLAKEGVDTSGIASDPGLPTGLASIVLDFQGENSIVVSPGANQGLRPGHLDRQVLSEAKVVLTQLEVPIETVVSAARVTGGLFLLNPAPAADLSVELLKTVDVLIPNRGELGILADVDQPRDVKEAVEAATSIEGPDAVVVTMGKEGALLVADRVIPIPAPPVDAIDTTGAGDAFCGSLAAALAEGRSLEEAVRRAVVAGAIATTREGAQTALPLTEEVDRMLGTL